ncbi:ribonuclease catalytic domain-containing protein [Cyanobium sp. Aljojuca 7D2]|uniref:ribonuclease catalytic domain-containing protein n=1 Tax=Cyanobium sp. Aljojuca 7D2 TaxID=2823698 RepID=UPI0028F402F4|nr:ribonuclease catalytic domain-containing protein [Cyanobium sp. Aljojuca 7D2]
MGLSDERGPQLAVVLSVQSNKASLAIGASGRQQIQPLRQLQLLGASPGDGATPLRLEQPPWHITEDALTAAAPSRRDVAAAWLLMQVDGQPLALPDWVDLVCSRRDGLTVAACWRWCHGPQTLFRLRQGQVEARGLNDLRQLRRERRHQQLQAEAELRWHQALRLRQPLDPQGLASEHQQQLELLERWAGGDCTSPLPTQLKQALHAAQCTADTGSIRHLLVDLGLWQAHHLPSLRATTWEQGFSAELLAEADRLLEMADADRPGDIDRVDLMGQRSVTIDDADTRDIDDGLALETTPTGQQRIWIHVADPGRLIEAHSPLDQEARRRGSSLYLAGGILPMFPEQLGTGPMSLRAGCRSAAWSLWVELDAEGAIAASGVQRSWVKPTYRLSYGDADDLIDLAPPQERDLADLHGLLQRRRQWRVRQGALLLDQPEGRIQAAGEEPLLEITEPSPARLLVAEAMILAGAVVAEIGREHNLALPYRSQLPAALPPEAELAALPAGPVRHAAIKRCLSRGHTGTQPSGHFSLGLPAYVQATSPIRRYADLVVQRQLLALQQQRQPLESEALQALLTDLEGPLRQGQQISREDQRHWQQVWFDAHRSDHWPATFLRWLRPQDRLGLVHVESLAMDLAADCPAGSDPGDLLQLRVHTVDPLRDQLRLLASG